MLPELTSTAQAFIVGDGFLTRLAGDFTEKDWRVRDAVGHDPRWLVGHLAAHRNSVLVLLGLKAPDAPWEAFFKRGTKAADLPEDLDLTPILEAFHGTQSLLAGKWEQLTPADLARDIGRALPTGSRSVGGFLAFMAWHEAYHLGQLAFLRRLAGKPGLA